MFFHSYPIIRIMDYTNGVRSQLIQIIGILLFVNIIICNLKSIVLCECINEMSTKFVDVFGCWSIFTQQPGNVLIVNALRISPAIYGDCIVVVINFENNSRRRVKLRVKLVSLKPDKYYMYVHFPNIYIKVNKFQHKAAAF